MQAGITRINGRLLLALLTAIAMVVSVFVLVASPAGADHEPPDDEVAHDGPGGTNETAFWVSYLESERGITDASCQKSEENGDQAFVMPAAPAGGVWVLLVVKQANTNWVYYDPEPGHSYPAAGQQGPGFSHVIMCSVKLPTTTTTEATTTTTEATTTTTEATTTTTEATTTTTTTEPEETTTTTEPEETTTTTIEDEVLGEEVTTTQPEETTTTVEDEVLAEELPFTGIDTGGLAIIASAMASLGLLVTLSARRIED
jgi:hypothetical protein